MDTINLQRVCFEIAKKLKLAGFPHPEEIKKGQLWFRPDGKPVPIENQNVNVFADIDFLPNKNRAAIYTPTVDDLIKEMPDWGIAMEGNKFVCFFAKKRYEGRTELEARTKAWIGEKGRKE